MLSFRLLGCVLILLCAAQGHRTYFGSCPVIKPMEDFDMHKFEGAWYVMELYEEGVECMILNISKGEYDGQWDVKETRESAWSSGTYGTLTQNKPHTGDFSINWSDNLLKTAYSFTIYTTDYTQVAGVFTCQSIFFGHRRQPFILSRSPTLHSSLRQTTRGMLHKYSIEMSYFSGVDTTKCPGQNNKDLDNKFFNQRGFEYRGDFPFYEDTVEGEEGKEEAGKEE